MSKAKEFWIFPEAKKIFASSIKDSIHVIEFKAYDTLLAKSLKLREALNKSKCALRYAYKITCYDYYLNASDDIDKALEEFDRETK